jgi:hypothetical protein
MTEAPITRDPDGAADEKRVPWGRIYAAVMVFAVTVILALWAFSLAFTP